MSEDVPDVVVEVPGVLPAEPAGEGQVADTRNINQTAVAQASLQISTKIGQESRK